MELPRRHTSGHGFEGVSRAVLITETTFLNQTRRSVVRSFLRYLSEMLELLFATVAS